MLLVLIEHTPGRTNELFMCLQQNLCAFQEPNMILDLVVIYLSHCSNPSLYSKNNLQWSFHDIFVKIYE